MKKIKILAIILLLCLSSISCREKEPVFQSAYQIKSEDITGVKKEKITLTLGCVDSNSEIENAVIQFNAENEQYIILIKEYTEQLEQSAQWQTAANLLLNDVLAGKGPDIIALDTDYLDAALLAEKGVLEDMRPFLAESGIIRETDIQPDILEVLLENEKLYMLPTNFAVQTFMAAKEMSDALTGNKVTWSIEDLMELAAGQPQAKDIVANLGRQQFMEWCLREEEIGLRNTGSREEVTDVIRNRIELYVSEQLP